jgi:fibronectin type 3 domain-containing protein
LCKNTARVKNRGKIVLLCKKQKGESIMKKVIRVFVLSVLFVLPAAAQVTSVLWGVSGEAWNTNGLLKDYSNVGYMYGNVAIPDTNAWPNGVNVTNFGAIANDEGDDSQAFINAIAACPSNQAVFVPNGRYIITDQIRVERDYVVLRGEDMYQTILFFPKNLAERYPPAEFDTSYGNGGFFQADGGTHKSIENLTMEFREQKKMGHWEHRYPNAIRYQGGVEHSWIRNIYFKNVDAAVTFSDADQISVLNLIMDHCIERYDFIGSSGNIRWVGHVGIGMGKLKRSLMHNIEFKGKYFHEFDIINVPAYNVVSSVKGYEMALHNHGQGANHNLYTEVDFGTGVRNFGALTDGQRVHHETYWNMDADQLIDPSSFTNCTGSNVFVGVHANFATEIRDDFYYESIDPDTLTPSNIYLAQLVYRGKPLPEPPPPQPPTPPELTGDVRILNPTDDISGAGGDPDGKTLGFGSYMKFDLSELQDLSTIAKARLKVCMTARKAGSGSFTLSVLSVADDSWTQDNIPSDPPAGSVQGSVLIDDEVRYKWWEIDITSYVQQEWGTDKKVSLKFSNDRSGTFLGSMGSRENGLAPKLFIERVADPVAGPPAAPTGVESISSNGWIRLNWDDNTEADFAYYNVYAEPAPNRDHPIAQDLQLSEFNNISDVENWDICKMASNTVFTYSVTAVDEAGYESARTDIFGTTLHGANNPPAFGAGPHSLTDAMTEDAYSESVASDASDPESDQLYFHMVSGPGWLSVSTNGVLSGTPAVSDAGNEQVVIQVTSIGGSDQATYSLFVDTDADFPVGAPAAPTNVVATGGDNSVILNWDDNSESDFDSYSVYRSTTSGSYGAALTNGLTASTYIDNSAVNGTTYYYVINARDIVGNVSSNSTEVSATPAPDLTPPAAPTGLAATAGEATVSLDWNDNSEPDLGSYRVYRSTTSGSGYSEIANSLSSSDYVDNTAVNGTTYYYVVTAVDISGNKSADSNEDSATPVDAAPAAPTGLAANAGDNVVSLDWNDNGESDLASYSVYRSTTSGSYGAALASNVSSSAYVDNTAVNGTTYYYVVTAVDNGSNESAYSEEKWDTPVQPSAVTVGYYPFNSSSMVSTDSDTNSVAGDMVVGAGVTQSFETRSFWSPTQPSVKFDVGGDDGTVLDDDYFSFTITPAEGVTLDFTTLSFIDRSGGFSVSVASDQDSFETVIDSIAVAGSWATNTLDLSSLTSASGATEIRLYFHSGSGISDNYTINASVVSGSPPLTGYALWETTWGTDIGVETNDLDADGLSNFGEYTLGGDPTNSAASGTPPEFMKSGNGFIYVHPQRSDDGTITYTVETTTNLITGGWTNQGVVAVGTNITGGTLDFVTNDVGSIVKEKFFRLKMEQ